MDRKAFRAGCRERRLLWGTTLLEHMTPATVRTMARAGFDWLWVDNEHSVHSYNVLQEVIRCAEDVGLITLLRVAQNEYAPLAQALEIGASGLIVPRIETVDHMRNVIECTKYPPVGRRGFGMRPQIFGKNRMTMAERIEDQNERLLVIQLESRRGVENVEPILDAGEGLVDAVLFGPNDFMMDIGKPDTPNDPELLEAVERVATVCRGRNVANCVPVKSAEHAKTWIDRGFSLISYGSDDGFMSGAAEEAREGLRGLEP